MRNDKIVSPLLDWKKDYAGVTSFYVDEEEADFVAVIHQRVPIWEIAQEVRQAALYDRSGILARLYRILLVCIGTCVAKFVSHINWECYEAPGKHWTQPMKRYPHLANFLLEGTTSELSDLHISKVTWLLWLPFSFPEILTTAYSYDSSAVSVKTDR